jgi:hypothetical protein
MRRSELLETVKRKSAKRASSRLQDVVETRLRFPRAVMRELHKIAADEGISFNALMASAAETCLEERGRQSIRELAPWFADYLSRRPTENGQADDEPNFG